ncbi:MAG: sensor histidine kinase [Chitinophagaceae bacterium]|nr:sensor histidine kinase [Chitinophagaceae bacterium]
MNIFKPVREIVIICRGAKWLLLGCFLLNNLSVWGGISEEDTLQINAWLAKAESLSNSSPDSALQYYQKAERESNQLKYPIGIVRAKVGQAGILIGQNLQASIAMANEVLVLCNKNQLTQEQPVAEANMLLAAAYEEQGRHDSSAYYYYLLSQQIENGMNVSPNFAVNLYTKLAIFWLNLYQGSALSPEYRELLGGYVTRARQAASQMESPRDAISSTYFLQGAYFHALQQYDSARFYYLDYIKEREALGLLNWQRKASTFANIAYSYLEENRPDEALEYLKKCKEVLHSPTAERFSDYFDSFTDLLLAKAYQQTGDNNKAVQLIEGSLIRLAGISDGMNLNVAEAYQTASLAYEAMGDLKQAIKYSRLYQNLNDSLKNKEKLDMINGMEVRYRMVEKDKELAESRLAVEEASQKVQKRNLMIGIVLGLLAFLAILGFVWNRKNVHKQKLQQAELDSLQRKLEIERLNATLAGEEMERNRIARELHDGVGGLLSAAKMNLELYEKKTPHVDKADLQEGISLLQVASVELRKTAHNLMPETLLHEGLAKAIHTGKTTVFPSQFEFAVYRIIQELVHNMVRHSKASEGLVEINYLEDGGMSITVEDNGIGLPQQNGYTEYAGLGLRNVKQRIKAIDGKLDIKSTPGGGTSFYVEFEPVKRKEAVGI